VLIFLDIITFRCFWLFTSLYRVYSLESIGIFNLPTANLNYLFSVFHIAPTTVFNNAVLRPTYEKGFIGHHIPVFHFTFRTELL